MVDVSERESGDSLLATSRGGLVSARGTSEGVVLRLDGRVPDQSLKVALAEFMEPRRTFLGGQEVALEWIGVRPGTPLVSEVTQILVDDFGVTVRASKVRDISVGSVSAGTVAQLPTRDKDPAKDSTRDSVAAQQNSAQASPSQKGHSISDSSSDDTTSSDDDEIADLFAGIDDFIPMDEPLDAPKKAASARVSLADPTLWDDPDARMIYSTLRSGQRIESEHSLIIIGDVNPGAEIVAGGDVIVLGSLRGIAHAGAYDETGGGRTIFALALQPTQLRIGSTISRGSPDGGKVPEIARVEGTMITVESFMRKSGPKRW